MKRLYILFAAFIMVALCLSSCASGVVVQPKGEVVVGGSVGGSTGR